MNIIYTAWFLILLSACTTIIQPERDNIEYSNLVNFYVLTEEVKNVCDKPKQIKQALPALLHLSKVTYTYSSFKGYNKENTEILKVINNNVEQLMLRYRVSQKVSIGYCKNKLSIMMRGLKSTIEVTEKRI